MNIETFRRDLLFRMRETGKRQSDLADEFNLGQPRLSLFLSGKSGISARYVFVLWPFVYGELPKPLSCPQPEPESEQA